MQLGFVMEKLESLGTEQTKKIWKTHGATGKMFGVNIGPMKQLIRELKLKNNTQLANELFLTENVDAMYLAGLVVNPKEMDIAIFKKWVELASWTGITESIIPWCAAESGSGFEVAMYCKTFTDEKHVSMMFAILSSYLIITPDNEVDIQYFSYLLNQVAETINIVENRVKYAMNGFLIATGTSCAPLYDKALLIAEEVGVVSVDMSGTSCKVPDAISSINKSVERYGVGRKRKTVRC